MNGYLLAASVSGFIIFAIHTWLGGPRIARPLLESEMPDIPKYVNYGTWHAMTICLFFMACAFGFAAFRPQSHELAWFAFLYNVALCAWSVGLIIWKKQKFAHIPHWLMFLTTSILAGVGLLS